VARKANVSLSAVSYVLNDSRHAQRISVRTKQRIQKAARDLGYRFDPIARALQRGYTNQVTLLIVSWNLATSHAATAMAISRAAARHGLQLTVHVADEDQAAESFLRRSMLHKQGGVLVLWDSPAMRESFLTQLATEGIPIIDLLPDSPPGISVVTPDREDAFLRGTGYLIELGHRQIALMCDPVTRQKTTLRKLAGYRRALAAAGLDGHEKWIEEVSEFGFEGGYEGYRRLCRRCPGVTGVICINDAIALGVVAAAREAGRYCPRDLSVIGFGDSTVGTYFPPRLTTFALSSDRVAQEALGLVVRQRQEPGREPQTILIPEELIVRESTAVAARTPAG
jgi:LacI family transcriptional regulator, repressor for deo operon, udp, cdd, tsx, nupC, and nupG